VAEADNSEDALKIVKDSDILLAIVDINIPYINGLKLSKLLREVKSDLSIIILTGYEEFSYAQEAIRIGVSNYLLKPLNVKELKKSLKEVHSKILERQQDSFIDSLNLQLSSEGMLKAKEEFLKILIGQSDVIPLETLQRGAELFGLNLTGENIKFFQVYLFDIEETEKKLQAIKNIQLTSLEKRYRVLLNTTVDYDNKPLIIAFWLEGDENKCKEMASEIALSMRHQVAVDLKGGCSIGVGKLVNSASQIIESYSSSVKALNMKFYTAQLRVYHYDKELVLKEGIDNQLNELFDSKRLLVMLRGGAENELLSLIRKGVKIMEKELLQHNQCRALFNRYLSTIELFLTEQKLSFAQILKEGENPYNYLNNLETLAAIKSWIELVTVTALVVTTDNGKTRTHFVVMQAKRFIEDNYSDNNLGLDSVAENVQVSSNYLSSTFKKILGVSLVSYLTEYRVAKAKQLIDSDPLLTIGEVAQAVGFNDSFYFSKVFSKLEGMSPSTYIKRKSGFFEINKKSYNS